MTLMTDKIDEKVNSIYEAALSFEKDGESQLAIQKCLEMMGYKQDYDFVASTLVGNIYWNLDDLQNAIKYFKQAVQIKPKNETASLGLFHTLWENGQQKQAFEEIKRFLSQFDASEKVLDEYSVLLDEMSNELIKLGHLNR